MLAAERELGFVPGIDDAEDLDSYDPREVRLAKLRLLLRRETGDWREALGALRAAEGARSAVDGDGYAATRLVALAGARFRACERRCAELAAECARVWLEWDSARRGKEVFGEQAASVG